MKLQPWGDISVERQASAESKFMEDWNDGEAAWNEFFVGTSEEFAEKLWPRFNRKTQKWEGAAARTAVATTIAELKFCKDVFQINDVLSEFPRTPNFNNLVSTPRDHLWHYRVEDFGGETLGENAFEKKAAEFPFSNLVYYDPSQNVATLWNRFVGLSKKKVGGTFRFKLEFLRPRPYTASVVLGISKFKHRTANRYVHTGMHPAFPSGHCIQGLLVAAGIQEQLSIGPSSSQIDVQALAQYAVDFGDRRVFAGVHYPTDNFASWINAIRLAPRIYADGNKARSFIVNAITTKSRVYREVSHRIDDYPQLRPAFEYLNNVIES